MQGQQNPLISKVIERNNLQDQGEGDKLGQYFSADYKKISTIDKNIVVWNKSQIIELVNLNKGKDFGRESTNIYKKGDHVVVVHNVYRTDFDQIMKITLVSTFNDDGKICKEELYDGHIIYQRFDL